MILRSYLTPKTSNKINNTTLYIYIHTYYKKLRTKDETINAKAI
jgi:hypothetical protein